MTLGESVRDDLYDDKVDEEDEERMLEKYKQERLEEMFPDEMDTPRDVAARIRLVNKWFQTSFIQNFHGLGLCEQKANGKEHCPCP